MIKYILAPLMALSLLAGVSFTVQADVDIDKKIRDVLTKKFPQSRINRIEKSAVPGLYEVEMPPHIFYISKDAKYVLNGDLIDLPADRNITQEKQAKVRMGSIDDLGEDSMIIFAPKNTKYTVSIFTDIDCSYCRKLHHEIGKYNELGIKVRYLAYPRSGPGSVSFKKAENVWCANDRKQAMTDAKNGKQVKSKDCKNPVNAHFTAGTKVGVNGTPAIFLESGQLIPGYVKAERLLAELKKMKL